MVGEQPGDQEDLSGKPFVGPSWKAAGPCLGGRRHRAGDTYVTNAVKHFKWEPRGKRRIHKKPSPRKSPPAVPGSEAELRIIRPKTVVCLGATATLALLGPKVRVLRDRGRAFSSPMARESIRHHPSLHSSFASRTEVRPNASISYSSAIYARPPAATRIAGEETRDDIHQGLVTSDSQI